MKNNRLLRFLAATVSVLMLTVSAGCEKAGKAAPENTESTVIDSTLPVIKSSDTTMALYMNIGLFDEENYSSVYIGNSIDLSIKYDGILLNVPSSSVALASSGFTLGDTKISTADMTIKAGETLETLYTDKNGKLLHVFFYNSKSRTATLSDCKIVRLKVDENFAVTGSKSHGTFEVGGVTNASAVTDVIEKLGTPSHFHDEGNGIYSLDYFVSKEDRRNKITVWINTEDDCITSIAVSDYR